MILLSYLKYYELVIVIILILCKASNSIKVKIDTLYTDLEPLRNTTNYYDYLSYAARKYRRQANDHFSESCKIPNNPPHTTYVILSKSEINYKPGDYVEKLTILETKCDKGYKLSPFASPISNCINGDWYQPPTICIRACPSLMSSATTIVKCRYNGIPLANCINPVKSTTVLVSCNEFYEEATLEKNPLRVCREGIWDPAIPECYPICGMKTPKGNTNIVGGSNAILGDYPWHIGIYTSQKEFQCGGSIIDQHIILSAAHCFTDYNGVVQPKENYLVAGGKYYREYDDERDKTAQYSTILEIHVPLRYRGIKAFQAFDIAILILKDPFQLSIGVQPVCIELNEESQYLHFSLNSQGIVMGWGYTQEGSTLSDVLKELTIPYIPFDQCFQEITESFRKYLTFDKICAGFTNNGTSVCGGDSGGGLVFKNSYNDRYYVKAIVSSSPTSATADVIQCDTNQYSVYTSIENHIEFVRELMTFNRRQTPVICIQDDCKTEQTGNVVNCRLPNNPLHGKYILPNQNDTYTPGNNVSQFVTLFLSCDAGYQASPLEATQFFCLDEGLAPAPGTCIENATAVSENFEEQEIPPIPDISNHKNLNLLASTSDCGIVDIIKKRIFNGNEVDLFEYPWMALLSHEDLDNTEERIFRCAGTIISDRYILTAAHCITALRYYRLGIVRVGEFNRNTNPDCEIHNQNISVCADLVQDIEIEDIIPHQNFTNKRKGYNIGLLRLRTPIQFKRSVRPICLPISNELQIKNFTNTRLIVTGWGTTSSYVSTPSSAELLHAKVLVASERECKRSYNRSNGLTINHLFLCAGGPEDRTCPGDPGGPLQGEKLVNGNLQYVQYGISSFGLGCGFVPNVYTRIDYYIDWILDNIRE